MKFDLLIKTISQTHDYMQQKAVSAVNQSLTLRNWLFGFYIVEYEQKGSDRAKYGQQLLKNIARELQAKKLKGVSERSLNYCVQFYTTYPQLGQVLPNEIKPEQISQTASAKSLKLTKNAKNTINGIDPELLLSRLSFSHIIELMQDDEELKRAFYEMQTIKGNWSVKELQRQRGSLLYERTGLSKNKGKVITLANDKALQTDAHDIIRDPYIFEFLGLNEQEVIQESDLEQKLLDQLQSFLLELGKGFCFEHRQKRILIDDEYYRIDLVFYHRILKCHVLIDLKTGKFTHADAGQMNVYLNYYKDQETMKGDNPPIGIILCSNKGEALVKYATTTTNQVFVSKYKIALPSERELKQFIEGEQK